MTACTTPKFSFGRMFTFEPRQIEAIQAYRRTVGRPGDPIPSLAATMRELLWKGLEAVGSGEKQP